MLVYPVSLAKSCVAALTPNRWRGTASSVTLMSDACFIVGTSYGNGAHYRTPPGAREGTGLKLNHTRSEGFNMCARRFFGVHLEIELPGRYHNHYIRALVIVVCFEYLVQVRVTRDGQSTDGCSGWCNNASNYDAMISWWLFKAADNRALKRNPGPANPRHLASSEINGRWI